MSVATIILITLCVIAIIAALTMSWLTVTYMKRTFWVHVAKALGKAAAKAQQTYKENTND